MADMEGCNIFSIRHLSPAGACYVEQFLDALQPKLVLIEGPCDYDAFLDQMDQRELKPPFAIMAYTLKPPVSTIVFPFARYSPEYRALLWAKRHGVECHFCDLPSEVVLALKDPQEEKESPKAAFYKAFEEQMGEEGMDGFWERKMEGAAHWQDYQKAAFAYGKQLREATLDTSYGSARNMVREGHMKQMMLDYAQRGTAPEKMALVCGAFHSQGILDSPGLDQGALASLPKVLVNATLMPYTYYRLSDFGGYGAGNAAPGYFEMLYEDLISGQENTAMKYLSLLAKDLRATGGFASSAQVIEGLQLAKALARLRGSSRPILRDVKDGAVTALGEGSLGSVITSMAKIEIGTVMGAVPEGSVNTSIQADFYNQLKALHLESYKTLVNAELNLDLRERLHIKDKNKACQDLYRSFFLHRLRVLGVEFGRLLGNRQDNATWSEKWLLSWSPEVEIALVEAVLKGFSIEGAAAFAMKEKMGDGSLTSIAAVIEDAFLCGMPLVLENAIQSLRNQATESITLEEIASNLLSLSVLYKYGDIRRVDKSPIVPLVEYLFLRACLNLPGECRCDDAMALDLAKAINNIHNAAVSLDFLDQERWLKVLEEVAGRDDVNYKLSGLCTAILLEIGRISNETLGKMLEFRLSYGIPAEFGAGYFEGLSLRGHYLLIARLSLWERLSQYLDSLGEEEFKRALVFLRRAFCTYDPGEKLQIAQNLARVWNVDTLEAANVLNAELNPQENEVLKELDAFDFDDF